MPSRRDGGTARRREVQLRWLAHARSGDKGDTANVGLICGHGCLYCSSRSVLRCHRAFKVLGLNPFDEGYCIVDPQTPMRLMNDVHKACASDVIMFCSKQHSKLCMKARLCSTKFMTSCAVLVIDSCAQLIS